MLQEYRVTKPIALVRVRGERLGTHVVDYGGYRQFQVRNQPLNRCRPIEGGAARRERLERR